MISRKYNPDTDLVDSTGKVAIVTGGNSGIGFSVLQQLARKGARVYMGARNQKKAIAAIARLQKEGLGPGNGTVHWLKLDYDDLKATKACAEEFMKKESRLDILINNAAILPGYKDLHEITSAGVLNTVHVNHVAPFLFTRTLIPLLTETAKEDGSDVRIVSVSSDAHTLIPPVSRLKSKDDLNLLYKGAFMEALKRYGFSKLLNVLHINDLQRRFDAEKIPITCISLHPGTVSTEGTIAKLTELPRPLSWIGLQALSAFAYAPSKGGRTTTIAAASAFIRDNRSQYKAAYLVPFGKAGSKSESAQNERLAMELWETTESLLADSGLGRMG